MQCLFVGDEIGAPGLAGPFIHTVKQDVVLGEGRIILIRFGRQRSVESEPSSLLPRSKIRDCRP